MPLIATRASAAHGAGFSRVTTPPFSLTGSFDALGTYTVPSGTSASVTFNGIPTDYQHLQLRIYAQTNRATYAIDDILLRFNADTSTNYSSHLLYGTGGGGGVPASTAMTSDTKITTGVGNITTSNATNVFGYIIIDILDYANVNKYKTVRVLGGSDSNGVGAGGYVPSVSLSSGAWLNSTTIGSITLYPEYGSAFTQYSSFALYGVK